MANISKAVALQELWKRGVLIWKLDPAQKELYNLFYNTDHKVQTWLLSRRAGKTYTLGCLAIEQCIRKPNSIVKFVAPTKLQIVNIVRPIFRQILEDCPEEIKPEFKAKDYIYYFPNGSEIQLAGTDNGHAEKLRGGDSHIAIIDEAGSCKDLDNVVKSILLPTTLITKGKVLLASTPPKEPDHEFIKFIEEAEMRGSLIKKTVYDNPRLTKEDIDELITELGGINTDACRRELFCEIIKDSKSCVIPEFTPELEKEIVKEWPKPPFFDCYDGMDLGHQDLTVVLFGYYDFRADKVIIEDELVIDFKLPDENIKTLTDKIMTKERELWFNVLTNEQKKPYLRVSDINYIVTDEIYKQSNKQVNFVATKKDDNESAINALRIMLATKKIIINPRCKTLIRHLRNVKWDNRTTVSRFARSPDDGHYDAVDALKYFVRSVVYSKNPYPAHYGYNTKDLHVQNPDRFYKGETNLDIYRKIYGIKPRN